MCTPTVREWRNRWQLHIRLKDVAEDAVLLQDMQSVNDHSRILAVAAVSALVENEANPPLESQGKTDSFLGLKVSPEPWKKREVSSDLVEGLEGLLYDSAVQVQVPSAITLCSIPDRHNEKVSITSLTST
jgi:hypothetical protein